MVKSIFSLLIFGTALLLNSCDKISDLQTEKAAQNRNVIFGQTSSSSMVVRVQFTNPTTGLWVGCSGTVVKGPKGTFILTARHCLEDSFVKINADRYQVTGGQSGGPWKLTRDLLGNCTEPQQFWTQMDGICLLPFTSGGAAAKISRTAPRSRTVTKAAAEQSPIPIEGDYIGIAGTSPNPIPPEGLQFSRFPWNANSENRVFPVSPTFSNPGFNLISGLSRTLGGVDSGSGENMPATFSACDFTPAHLAQGVSPGCVFTFPGDSGGPVTLAKRGFAVAGVSIGNTRGFSEEAGAVKLRVMDQSVNLCSAEVRATLRRVLGRSLETERCSTDVNIDRACYRTWSTEKYGVEIWSIFDDCGALSLPSTVVWYKDQPQKTGEIKQPNDLIQETPMASGVRHEVPYRSVVLKGNLDPAEVEALKRKRCRGVPSAVTVKFTGFQSVTDPDPVTQQDYCPCKGQGATCTIVGTEDSPLWDTYKCVKVIDVTVAPNTNCGSAPH